MMGTVPWKDRDPRLERYRAREAENPNDHVPIEWHGPIKRWSGMAAIMGSGAVITLPIMAGWPWFMLLLCVPWGIGTFLGGALIWDQGKWEMAYLRRLADSKPPRSRPDPMEWESFHT